VIASGLSPADRVVTTGLPTCPMAQKSSRQGGADAGADLAPRKKRSSKECAGNGPQAKDAQGERRGKRGERNQAKAIKRVKPDPRREASRRAAERSRSHDRKIRRLNV